MPAAVVSAALPPTAALRPHHACSWVSRAFPPTRTMPLRGPTSRSRAASRLVLPTCPTWVAPPALAPAGPATAKAGSRACQPPTDHYKPAPCPCPCRPLPLPQDGATWGRIKSMPLCWAADFLRASHTCSYMCYLSELAGDQSVDGSMCWLSAKPGDAPGSQCTGFPNGWLSPMAAGVRAAQRGSAAGAVCWQRAAAGLAGVQAKCVGRAPLCPRPCSASACPRQRSPAHRGCGSGGCPCRGPGAGSAGGGADGLSGDREMRRFVKGVS